MNQPDVDKTAIRDRVRRIVRAGGEVRGSVSALVQEVGQAMHAGGESVLGLAGTVLKSASETINQTDFAGSREVLRAVIDGVGDGFSVLAHATHLAVQEAQGRSEQFASEDLRRVIADFESLGALVQETSVDAALTVAQHVESQSSELLEHAEKTAARLQPKIKTVLGAMNQGPTQLGAETIAASEKVVGSLFSRVGELLVKAGKDLERGGSGTHE